MFISREETRSKSYLLYFIQDFPTLKQLNLDYLQVLLFPVAMLNNQLISWLEKYDLSMKC